MKRLLIRLSLMVLFAGTGLAQHPVVTTGGHPKQAMASEQPSADAVWAKLVSGNRRFIAGKPHPQALVPLRQKLASGQNPNVIVLSCSDSRVSPEVIFDQSLGDLFVVRTAGNVAGPVDLGSIEYAVDHIHSPLLVVLGHQKCGAVTAACSGEKMPSTNLDAIMEKIHPAVEQTKSSVTTGDIVEPAIKENVHQSAKDLLANSEIIRAAVSAGKLKVVEAEYMLDTGEVIRLNPPSSASN
jgi:carbonic anhydrase